MTDIHPTSPLPSATPAVSPTWVPCDHCQAPLDERQRYCVQCGARRPLSEDPVAQYFLTNARRARAAEAAGPQGESTGRPRSSPLLALALALLPIAAAAGVAVGRSGSDDGDALVRAVQAQKAPIVNVLGSGAAAGATASDSGTTGKKAAAAKDDARQDDGAGKVIARTKYGAARQLTGARVTQRQIKESKKAIEHIVNARGKAYVEQQRNLPDQIVIP